MLYSMNGIKTNARTDVDLVLDNLEEKILGQPIDEVLLTADRWHKHYKANGDRLVLENGLLFQIYYRETGSVKYYQVHMPKQLVGEVLRNLHGEIGRYTGITSTKIAYKKKYYYPSIEQLIKKRVILFK